MKVAIKRVYESATPSDGVRVLVDRLWPRGLTKERAGIDEWLRDLAPSNELRKWYHARPDHWQDFRKSICENSRRRIMKKCCSGCTNSHIRGSGSRCFLLPRTRPLTTRWFSRNCLKVC